MINEIQRVKVAQNACVCDSKRKKIIGETLNTYHFICLHNLVFKIF